MQVYKRFSTAHKNTQEGNIVVQITGPGPNLNRLYIADVDPRAVIEAVEDRVYTGCSLVRNLAKGNHNHCNVTKGA